MGSGVPRLSLDGFESIREALHEGAGIRVSQSKRQMVEARVTARLRALGMLDFESYVSYALGEGRQQELANLVDVLTTNLTGFMREPSHFEFMKRNIFPGWRESDQPVRIWSAGCSTGEEPYSVAMMVLDELGQEAAKRVRILATDVSGRAIEAARDGEYSAQAVAALTRRYRDSYFTCGGDWCRVKSALKMLVSFARANLMDTWPMSGPFDLILCRNVMIYFDPVTTAEVVARFAQLQRSGAYLFIGHSELLGPDHPDYSFVKPAVYRRD